LVAIALSRMTCAMPDLKRFGQANTAVFKLMRYTTEERKLEIKPVLLLTPEF